MLYDWNELTLFWRIATAVIAALATCGLVYGVRGLVELELRGDDEETDDDNAA